MQQVSSSIGKESACNTRAWVGKIPWKRQWQSTPVFLSEEFHGQRSLASYCPQGLKGCMPQPLMPKKLNLNGAMKIYKTFSSRTNNQKRSLCITGDWNAKVGNQEIPGVTGKFCLGVQNEAGQRLTELCQENMLVIANTLFQ